MRASGGFARPTVDSPWFYVFYTSNQVFDGGMYEVNKVAVVKREAGGFRIHRDRMLNQKYDLTKSPPRNFVESDSSLATGHSTVKSYSESL